MTKMSDEHKRCISESMMGNKNLLGYKFTAEQRRCLSEGMKGNRNHRGCLGYKFTEEQKNSLSLGHRGKSYSTKGKTYEEMYGEEEAERLKELRSLNLKEYYRNHRHHLPRPSYWQHKLYKAVCRAFPDQEVFSEYRVVTEESCRYIDIAIPLLMYGFEYDGDYWHKNTDTARDQDLSNLGWRIAHFHNKNRVKYIVGRNL